MLNQLATSRGISIVEEPSYMPIVSALSVAGKNHQNHDKVNQDSHYCNHEFFQDTYNSEAFGKFYALYFVCDGHGSYG